MMDNSPIVMDEKTEIALKGSVRKWKRIVRSTKAEDNGRLNCPLCKLFWWGVPKCSGCLISKYCEGTPYDEWHRHASLQHSNFPKHRQPYCKECLRLAKEELKFLEELLARKYASNG